MTALRRRMDQDMVLRGMADKTREAYQGSWPGSSTAEGCVCRSVANSG